MAAKRRARPRAAPPVIDDTAVFERLLKKARAGRRYRLRLFITGSSPRSAKAVSVVRALCEEFLTDRYELEVVDIYQQPGAVADDQIIAAPTLLKTSPLPVRRLIGDLSDREKVLVGLNLAPAIAGRATTPGRTRWANL